MSFWPHTTSDAVANQIVAGEYADFCDFLQEEYGTYGFRELYRKFEISVYGEASTYDENFELIKSESNA